MSKSDRLEQKQEEEEEEDGVMLDLGLCDDLFGEIEVEQQTKAMRKKGTGKEIRSLCEHIGGFHLWSQLIDDCKVVVAKFLDCKTLVRLGMCSKADNALSKKVPVYLHTMDISDSGKYSDMIVSLRFEDAFYTLQKIEMVFSQSANDTEMRWTRYTPRQEPVTRTQIIEDSHYYHEGVKFAEVWMQRCHYKIQQLDVAISNSPEYPIGTSAIRSLPDCTDVRIDTDSLEPFDWWLDKLPNEIQTLRLELFSRARCLTLPSDTLCVPQVMNAKNLGISCRADITDELILELKAEKFSFEAVNLTDEGINEFLQMWANGKRAGNFKRAHISLNRTVDKQIVTRGLLVRLWDEAFRKEEPGFCGCFNRKYRPDTVFYQISSRVDAYASLTVEFGTDEISIIATGKKSTRYGQNYTKYSIPS